MNHIYMQHGNCSDPAPYQYKECGLESVYLNNGYTVDLYDGEEYVSVKEVEQLHEAIGLHLVEHRKILTGPELRFLRKNMDLTQTELGNLLGVTDQTVARWEKGATKEVPGSALALIRLIFMSHVSGEINADQFLQDFIARDDGPSETRLTFDGGQWLEAA